MQVSIEPVAIKRCDYFQARLLGQIQVYKCIVGTIELKHAVNSWDDNHPRLIPPTDYAKSIYGLST